MCKQKQVRERERDRCIIKRCTPAKANQCPATDYKCGYTQTKNPFRNGSVHDVNIRMGKNAWFQLLQNSLYGLL